MFLKVDAYITQTPRITMCARIFLLLTTVVIVTKSYEPIVKIEKGIIVGTASSDGVFDKFEGIPYAEPPLGKRRFRPPIPLSGLKGKFHANRTNLQCAQIDPLTKKFVGTEDCLVLNIYRQRRRKGIAKKQAVMIFIHGGGFYFGSGGVYGPEFLIKYGVILVTVNYRLGSLGFLCFKTEDIPGNAGLKDQRAALRWVKKNIHAFGGDSKSITVFGESSGAISVDLHILTETTEQLFHKAIAQSGSAITEWAIDRTPFERVFNVAKILGENSCDAKRLTTFYQNVDCVRLLEASRIYDGISYPTTPSYVCIEDCLETTEPFLTDYPSNIIKSGRKNNVTLLTGVNNGEGIFTIFWRDPNKIIANLDQHFINYLPRDLCFESKRSKIKVANIIRQYYFGDSQVTKDNLGPIVNYFTDEEFLPSAIRNIEARLLISHKPTYFYEFSYEGQRNLKNFLGATASGAGHSDELPYLFNMSGIPFPTSISADDQIIIDRMTTMWTNFAKHDNPIPEVSSLLPVKWAPVSFGSLEALSINLNMSTLKRPHQDRIAFWDIIYNNYDCDDFNICD